GKGFGVRDREFALLFKNIDFFDKLICRICGRFLYVDIQQKTKLVIANKVAVFNENSLAQKNHTKIPLTKEAVGTII
ncbi:MAG: hypothetical protein ACI4JI_07300, partial [Ruminiclostridium sp.]